MIVKCIFCKQDHFFKRNKSEKIKCDCKGNIFTYIMYSKNYNSIFQYVHLIEEQNDKIIYAAKHLFPDIKETSYIHNYGLNGKPIIMDNIPDLVFFEDWGKTWERYKLLRVFS